MAFGDKFKAMRNNAGISQEQLAGILGVTKRTIINYETNQTLPPTDLLSKIARYFGVSIDSLVSEQEEFVALAYERGGGRGASEAEALVAQVSGLFAGGRLSDEDKDAVMRAIQNAYWVAKEESKRKYTPKKYREKARER
ncbi:MAG: helix-turn-helix domain-containing protein [Firmicutes bacterium]|nr:helix-turn-helix domain-containing protein [Bacillota bacterium]